MSEHQLKFLLSAFSTVRIVCQGNEGKCGHVFETTLDKLDTFFQKVPECPFCKTTFALSPPKGGKGALLDPFNPLAQAICNLTTDDAAQKFKIQFVLPEKK